MIKVAVLDDYQNIFGEFINTKKYKDKYEFTIFNFNIFIDAFVKLMFVLFIILYIL